MNNRERM